MTSWDHLDFAAMGYLQINRDKWSILADLSFARLGAENSNEDIDFDARLDQFIVNFMVTRNVLNTGCTRLDVYAGLRLTLMETIVGINFPSIQYRSLSQRETWVDPITGVRFRALGDVGGFTCDVISHGLLPGYEYNF